MSERSKPTIWALAALLALLLTGCSSRRAEQPWIDGWPLGAERACLPPASAPGLDIVTMATTYVGLTPSDVVNVHCYSEGMYIDSNGEILMTRSGGGIIIVVVTLSDGSRQAVGVHCPNRCRPIRPIEDQS